MKREGFNLRVETRGFSPVIHSAQGSDIHLLELPSYALSSNLVNLLDLDDDVPSTQQSQQPPQQPQQPPQEAPKTGQAIFELLGGNNTQQQSQ